MIFLIYGTCQSVRQSSQIFLIQTSELVYPAVSLIHQCTRRSQMFFFLSPVALNSRKAKIVAVN